jgi:hypothetical protein
VPQRCSMSCINAEFPMARQQPVSKLRTECKSFDLSIMCAVRPVVLISLDCQGIISSTRNTCDLHFVDATLVPKDPSGGLALKSVEKGKHIVCVVRTCLRLLIGLTHSPTHRLFTCVYSGSARSTLHAAEVRTGKRGGTISGEQTCK